MEANTHDQELRSGDPFCPVWWARWMLAVSHAVGGRNGHHMATRTSLNTLATCVPVVAQKPSGAAWRCGDGIR